MDKVDQIIYGLCCVNYSSITKEAVMKATGLSSSLLDQYLIDLEKHDRITVNGNKVMHNSI